METKERKEAIKLIKSVWNKCEYILNNKGWCRYGNELLLITRDESKKHDRFRDDSIKRGLTITEESKFFAVQRLTSYLYELDNIPSLDGYHHTQKSVYYAYSLAQEFQTELKTVVTLETATKLKELDYCKLIEVI